MATSRTYNVVMSNSPYTIDTSPTFSELASCARARLVLLLLINACLPLTKVLAHPEGFSGMHVTIGADRIRVAVTLHTRDLDAWFPPAKYPDYVADVTREMENTIDEIVELQIEGRPRTIESVKAFLLEVGLIEIDVVYQLPDSSDPVELLVWSKHLIRMPRGHQQLLFVEDRRQIAPGTPQGVMRILSHYGIDPSGKRAVIVGRSFLVGRPLSMLMAAKGTDATVTAAHSRTPDIAAVAREADILVAAVGVPGLIGRDAVKPGATVIDVGINRTDDGLVGDVAFDEVQEVAGAITPVPGGVGPMTVAMLMRNTVAAAERSMG